MPRIRAVRTKEEAAEVPKDKPLTIELAEEGVVNLDDNPFEEDAKTKEPPKKKVSAPPPQEQEDDDSSDLKRQLEEMRAAQGESDRRLQAEIRARQEAERLRDAQQAETSNYRLRAEDAEYDAILNAISAAQGEAERAQYDIALAHEASDHRAVADANRRLARAESRLTQLEDGKYAIEQNKSKEVAKAKEAKEKPPEPKQLSVEEYIDQIPTLISSQKDWLKKHPETMTDQRLNMRLQGAHVEAEDKNLRPGTPAYFKYLEERLGYAQPDSDDDDEPAPKGAVSAPPSKSATSPTTGRPSGNRITLTEQEREAAHMSGIDEVTYAKNKVRMLKAKADGLIN